MLEIKITDSRSSHNLSMLCLDYEHMLMSLRALSKMYAKHHVTDAVAQWLDEKGPNPSKEDFAELGESLPLETIMAIKTPIKYRFAVIEHIEYTGEAPGMGAEFSGVYEAVFGLYVSAKIMSRFDSFTNYRAFMNTLIENREELQQDEEWVKQIIRQITL